jgi:ElaB/YqjD/DUF883 family membrane-anchored ribosome-binding protein
MRAQTRVKDVSTDKLVSDLKLVVSDAEELLRVTATQAGDKASAAASAARERVQASIAAAKEQLSDTHIAMLEKGREAIDATDELVHEHPWQAVGLAALAGVAVGVLLSRR